ncbi:MAG: DNA translocase FtsK 4TM domain-containing protein [Bacilli bacterium]|nr:DNA translocase FtsK 4TM domain-containing protein [Bacilli bacterium]
MAKKKKRKEEEVEPVGYIVELKGIFLVLIAIVGLCPFGMVADFIKGFSCFLFGTLWALFLVVLCGIGLYTIIKRKQPKIVTGKSIGLFIIIIGILTLLHISYIEANEIDPNNFNILEDGMNVLKTTVDNVMKGIKQDFWIPETGGGIIGAIFVSVFATLLTLNGTWFICFALIVCGLIIYTGLTIFEMMKKTKDEVKKVAGKVHVSKRERKKKEQVKEEPEVEVVIPVTDDKPSKRYVYPPISLLNKPIKTDGKENELAIKNNIPILIQVLMDFGIEAKVVDTHVGPAVTQYELEIKAGTKVSKILSLNREIALALAAKDVRIQAPIPGKSTIGIELPNRKISMVSVREVLTSLPASKVNSKLLTVLGRDIMGNPQWMEINKTPHLLVAGATGSGKSVCINSILASILMRAKPDEVKLVLVDPKKVELSIYNGVPHLMAPVVTDPKRANVALKRIVAEMERRYEVFEESKTKNIESYNAYIDKKNEGLPEEEQTKRMPFIVVVIDELADLMLVAAKEVEDSIMRITQMARAAGIHLIVATQRPSTDVITGIVKANIPSRISFAVSSGIDSRTILDMVGAEKLLGKGDMLFLPQGTNAPVRIQGTFISEDETKAIVDYVCNQQKASYDESLLMDDEERGATTMLDSRDDYEEPLYNEIVDFVIEQGKASASLLQRRFRLGYNRAARCIDLLEDRGIVGPQNGSKPREVLVKKDDEED